MFFKKSKRIKELESENISLLMMLDLSAILLEESLKTLEKVDTLLEDARCFETEDYICLGLVDKKERKDSEKGKKLKNIIDYFEIKDVEYDER